MKARLLVILGGIVLLATHPAAVSPPATRYSFVDLGDGFDGRRPSVAEAINSHGHVVGYSEDFGLSGSRKAFYFDGVRHDLPVSNAYAISNFDMIVGGTATGAYRYADGQFESLGFPSGYINATGLTVDDAGRIFGMASLDPSQQVPIGFDGGSWVDLGGLSYSTHGYPYKGTPKGDALFVAGHSGDSILSAGVYLNLPGTRTGMVAIAANGDTAGNFESAEVAVPVAGQAAVISRGMIRGFRFRAGFPAGLNSLGDAVFTKRIPDSSSTVVLVAADGSITDLNEVTDLPAGYRLYEAAGINDSGVIACRVKYIVGDSEVLHACLLTPQATSRPWFTSGPADAGLSATASSGFDSSVRFTSVANGLPAPAYRWQESTDGGGTWTDLTNGGVYTGATAQVLTVSSPSQSLNGRRYRVRATNSAGSATSNAAVLTLTTAPVGPAITTAPAPTTMGVWNASTLSVSATGSEPLRYQWYRNNVAIPLGTRAQLSIVNAQPAHAGTYTVTVSNGAGSVTSTGATVSVRDVIDPGALSFAAVRTSAGAITAVTGVQMVDVLAGTGEEWTAATTSSWLQLSGTGGTGPGRFSASVNTSSPALVGRTAPTTTITITFSTWSVEVPVALIVEEGVNVGRAPIGYLDTPANAATVDGSVAINGWAVDDIGVSRVEIWRNCEEAIDRPRGACTSIVSGGPANAVFVGRGAFISGARPDIETAYPSWPQTSAAGWGYLLLTNALPDLVRGTPSGGQGTFTLTAVAFDQEGQATVLGQRTIIVNNDGATRPFGTLDTPEPGGGIPGPSAPFNDVNAYPNFGWALAPVGRCIDTSNTTAFRVYIDGVSRTLIPGVNWFAGLNRSDVAAAFPGRCNSTTAGAAYYINATALGLATGIHTIGWDVIDSLGQAAGIGSRFFRVVQGAADTPVSTDVVRAARAAEITPVRQLANAEREVLIRVGGEGRVWQRLHPEAGNLSARFPTGSRIALDLGGSVRSGHQVVGVTPGPLPSGSSLDPARGHFAWEPPLGFLGSFNFRFDTNDGAVDVALSVIDSTVGRGPVELVVDTLPDGAIVSRLLRVAGWAVDPSSVSGSGIDAIHVWATRIDTGGAVPQFLGVAALNVPRPDLAIAFGPFAGSAGFEFSRQLERGRYDVIISAWCIRTGRWEIAKTIRVVVQ